MKNSRRKFIKKSTVGLWGATMLSSLPILGQGNRILYSKGLPVDMFHEDAKDIPIVEEVDVVVCGGGPAGIAAAIAAARTGAKVRLLEVHGCLGGVWTAGMLAWLFDFDKPGITYELTKELEKRGARRGTNPSNFVYEIEEMKLLLEEKCIEAGVKFQLFTRVVAAYKDNNNNLTTIITESKSGRQAWVGKTFIDATGDGDLGALAGCGWDYGNKDGSTQPMTFMSLITVDKPEQISDCISFYKKDGELQRNYSALTGEGEHSKKWGAFLKELNRAGIDPSYSHPTLFQIRDNLIALMINHEYGVDPFNADQMTAATVRGRAEVNKAVKALRKLGGKWDSIQLVASCEQIGVREGRRIHGIYTVTDSDLIMGIRHKDAIARVTFEIDIHASTKDKNKEQSINNYNPEGLIAKPYDIPIRALIAKDVNGLLMAGRCISGDFIAHASYRVTGNSVAMGQAAGVLGALSSANNLIPQQVPWEEIDESLQNLYRICQTAG